MSRTPNTTNKTKPKNINAPHPGTPFFYNPPPPLMFIHITNFTLWKKYFFFLSLYITIILKYNTLNTAFHYTKGTPFRYFS